MKAVGYKKSLPIDDAESLFDFEAAKPEPKGRDIRVAVKAISANPVDYKVRKRAAPALVIAAPPRTLADLRNALHADVKARIVGEIDKDFTKHPVWEIERRIIG